MSKLFSPYSLKSVTFRNRVAVSPMSQYRARDGVANDWHIVHLGRFAMGGAGLVIAEATAVTEDGRRTHGDLGLKATLIACQPCVEPSDSWDASVTGSGSFEERRAPGQLAICKAVARNRLTHLALQGQRIDPSPEAGRFGKQCIDGGLHTIQRQFP